LYASAGSREITVLMMIFEPDFRVRSFTVQKYVEMGRSEHFRAKGRIKRVSCWARSFLGILV